MKRFGKVALSALTMAGAAALFAMPASAYGGVGFSFGYYSPGYVPFSDPCDYYDYYDAPPPWGLPPDYCDYPVYFEPVYFGGYWYRGPIYYRWYGGSRLFWINGGWHRDEWRGGRPDVHWTDRGGWGRYHSGAWGDRGRSGGHTWSGNRTRDYSGSGNRNWSGSHNNWSGTHTRSYSGGWSGSHNNWSGSGTHTRSYNGGGGSHNWSGGGGYSGGHGGGGHGGRH